MSNRVALTEHQKAKLFDQLIEKHVIAWRVGPRMTDGKLVERTYIEHGPAKDMFVVDDDPAEPSNRVGRTNMDGI